jgi:hypothetical protein
MQNWYLPSLYIDSGNTTFGLFNHKAMAFACEYGSLRHLQVAHSSSHSLYVLTAPHANNTCIKRKVNRVAVARTDDFLDLLAEMERASGSIWGPEMYAFVHLMKA